MAGVNVLERLTFIQQLAASPSAAIRDNHQSLSYAELVTAVADLANWIQEFKQQCDHVPVVALQADNSLQWVVADLACQVADVVCLPLPSYFSVEQIQHCLDTSQASLLLADNPAIVQTLQKSPRRLPGVPAVSKTQQPLLAWQLDVDSLPVIPAGTGKITFTSGSTGNPKGVCISHQHQWQVAESLADAIAIKAPKHLCLLPLATLLENIAGVYTPLLCGGEVVVLDAQQRGFLGSSGIDTQRLLATIGEVQPNTLILIPQLLLMLVAAAEAGWCAPASLQFIAVGGARVDPALLQRARQLGLPVYEGYGLSECGSVVALNTPAADKAGAVGKVLSHCAVQIVNGDVMVTGSSFLGYLGEPDSWYPQTIATGDEGEMHDGWLRIAGRRKNLLITAFGRNINPEWVESALQAKPLLNPCVVLGDDRPFLVALVGAPEGVNNALIDTWITEVNSQLPDYARVQAWQRLDARQWQGLMTANGRPQRGMITRQLAEIIDQLYQRQTANAGQQAVPTLSTLGSAV